MLTCARCGNAVQGQAIETPMGWMHAECAGAPIGASAATGGAEGLGTTMVLLPLVATALIWFWVGSMNLLQDPSGNLIMLTIGTIGTTGFLMALEASQLGMGVKLDARGKPSSGPVVWFVFACVFWILAFPWYLSQRGHYGRRSLWIQGLLIGLIFVGSAFAVGSQIDAQKTRVRDSLQHLQNQLGR